MSDMVDQTYLLAQQYNTSSNLNARIQLHERFSTNPLDWHRWVFEQFQIPENSRVLELGSGTGLLAIPVLAGSAAYAERQPSEQK